ncbi:transcriptional regulator HxlR family [Micromonospora sp. B006]|nr:transcriptional regulator HxlR family [Micromonospora sp. B006]
MTRSRAQDLNVYGVRAAIDAEWKAALLWLLESGPPTLRRAAPAASGSHREGADSGVTGDGGRRTGTPGGVRGTTVEDRVLADTFGRELAEALALLSDWGHRRLRKPAEARTASTHIQIRRGRARRQVSTKAPTAREIDGEPGRQESGHGVLLLPPRSARLGRSAPAAGRRTLGLHGPYAGQMIAHGPTLADDGSPTGSVHILSLFDPTHCRRAFAFEEEHLSASPRHPWRTRPDGQQLLVGIAGQRPTPSELDHRQPFLGPTLPTLGIARGSARPPIPDRR